MISVVEQSAGVACPQSLIVEGPLQSEIIGLLWFVDFCHGIQNWDSWRVASLRKPFLARGELSGWLGNQDPDV